MPVNLPKYSLLLEIYEKIPLKVSENVGFHRESKGFAYPCYGRIQ